MTFPVGITEWTRSGIEVRLIAAFTALPSAPVFRPSARIRSVTGEHAEAIEALNWCALLDVDPNGRNYLWAWARCRATNSSFADLCRLMGWKRSTAETGRRRAADILVAILSCGSGALDSGTGRSGACETREAVSALVE